MLGLSFASPWLRRTWPSLAGRRPRIGVQHLLGPGRDTASLQRVLDSVGDSLDVAFDLHHGHGEIVLLDEDLASRLSIQQIDAFKEERPLVTLPGQLDSPLRVDAKQHAEQVRQALAQQLAGMSLVRQRRSLSRSSLWPWRGHGTVDTGTRVSDDGSTPALRRLPLSEAPRSSSALRGTPTSLPGHPAASTGAGPAVFAVPAVDPRQWYVMVAALRHGRHDRGARPMTIGYGAGAGLFFDFQSGRVHCDVLALQYLRLRRELPLVARSAAAGSPGADAVWRSVDAVLWDLGLASGAMPLWGSTGNSAHQLLRARDRGEIACQTRTPSHLDAARWLCRGPCTPSELRRRVGLSEPDLRRFLQAVLFLDLAHWVTVDTPVEAQP
jgi:hypothetical protein